MRKFYGINDDVIRRVSNERGEPYYFTKWRLNNLSIWKRYSEPHWGHIRYHSLNYADILSYATSGLDKKGHKDIGKALLKEYEELGIPIGEYNKLANVALDIVQNSESIFITAQEELHRMGIIFCSMREAIARHSSLVKKYLGTVVPASDNFFAALNSSVFSDGSFLYIPPNVKCPIEISTYFRITLPNLGQFERTLIVADVNSEVSYLEGCTAPIRKNKQLHCAVVEIIALAGARVRYSTVQNWYPGTKKGKGGIYNFVTKRGIAHENASITWSQVEVGSACTWKYPSVILKGPGSIGKFFSLSISKNSQQADTGTKMIHLAPNCTSEVMAKSIVSGRAVNTHRSLLRINPLATNSVHRSVCDSLLIGKQAISNAIPTFKDYAGALIDHEASVSIISPEQIFYLASRSLDRNEAIASILYGFSHDIFSTLPIEFAIEARALINSHVKKL